MITLTEDEKRMVFQLEGCHRYDAIQGRKSAKETP